MKSAKLLEELRTLEQSEILEKIEGWKQELMNLRFRGASQQLEAPGLIAQVRRNIARAQTVIREEAKVRESVVEG